MKKISTFTIFTTITFLLISNLSFGQESSKITTGAGYETNNIQSKGIHKEEAENKKTSSDKIKNSHKKKNKNKKKAEKSKKPKKAAKSKSKKSAKSKNLKKSKKLNRKVKSNLKSGNNNVKSKDSEVADKVKKSKDYTPSSINADDPYKIGDQPDIGNTLIKNESNE